MNMYCKNCGKEIKIGVKFCKNCGKEIKVGKIYLFRAWFKNHRKTILIIIIIIAILLILGSYNSSSNVSNDTDTVNTSNNTTETTTVPNNKLNPNQIPSSVVNILCDENGGSGTIFTEDGYILTNYHVISESTDCVISIPNLTTGTVKEIYFAEAIAFPKLSKLYDIALLKIYDVYTDDDGKTWGEYPTNFPAYQSPTDCKETPNLGDTVRIYGYPVTSGGYNLTITDGIISSFTDYDEILTSAKIDSGNSGGLAVDKNGCFLGIPSAVVSGNYQNLGVIIPNSILLDFIDKVESQQDTITPEPTVSD